MASLPAKAKLILPLLLLLGVAAAAPLKAKKEFDYFALPLTWSGTKCLNVKECCSTNGCCNPDVGSEFTIRGFWPDYNDGTWPACCNGTTFNEDEIPVLMQYLERYWPSYYCTLSSACGSPKGSNWAYEEVNLEVLFDCYSETWNMCLPSTNNPICLLLHGSNAFLHFQCYSSNSAAYPVEGITSAIKNALGVTPIVSCYGDAVKEVQLCFDKMLKLQECPTTESGMLSKSSSDECPSSVRLPIKNVTLGKFSSHTKVLIIS
nr:ribonuclease 2-like [Ipomoea batatas]